MLLPQSRCQLYTHQLYIPLVRVRGLPVTRAGRRCRDQTRKTQDVSFPCESCVKPHVPELAWGWEDSPCPRPPWRASGQMLASFSSRGTLTPCIWLPPGPAGPSWCHRRAVRQNPEETSGGEFRRTGSQACSQTDCGPPNTRKHICQSLPAASQIFVNQS